MNEFCEEKVFQWIDDFALKFYQSRSIESLSFDEITNKIMTRVSWGIDTNFKEAGEKLYRLNGYVSKVDYYYDQIMKKVCAEGRVDLSSSEFIDFWSCAEQLNLSSELFNYKHQSVDDKNSFSFLKIFKEEVRKVKFLLRFKIKSVEMIQYKGEKFHEAR